jgi:NAD(P)-dependent dehydrogenase (short-subunit alcohol dehydrogenase family)
MQVAVLDITVPPAKVNCLSLQADVTDAAQVREAFTAIRDHFGRIDVLINNAGISGSQEATVCHLTPPAEWERVMAVNVRGPFLCAQAVLPTMIEQGSGHIINIASIAGFVAFPGRSAYTASKGALVQFTRSLAVDYIADVVACLASDRMAYMTGHCMIVDGGWTA